MRTAAGPSSTHAWVCVLSYHSMVPTATQLLAAVMRQCVAVVSGKPITTCSRTTTPKVWLSFHPCCALSPRPVLQYRCTIVNVGNNCSGGPGGTAIIRVLDVA